MVYLEHNIKMFMILNIVAFLLRELNYFLEDFYK